MYAVVCVYFPVRQVQTISVKGGGVGGAAMVREGRGPSLESEVKGVCVHYCMCV